jgi:hypothetical protein
VPSVQHQSDLYYRWRDPFLQGGLEGLVGKPSVEKERKQIQTEIAENEQMIGKLTRIR